MVTFALSQSVWEFAKSLVIRAKRASVVYVPRAKRVPINVPMCQSCANNSTLPAKGLTSFSSIFQNNFSIF